MPIETNNEQSSSVNQFVREGRESAAMPGRPESVVQAYEAAFKMPIDQIDAMVLGRTASQDMIDGPTPEAAPIANPVTRLVEVFQKGRAKLNEFGDATGLNKVLIEERGEVSPRLVAIGAGVLVLATIGIAIGQQAQRDSNAEIAATVQENKQEAEDTFQAAIEKAATEYSEDETFVGSFTIDPENPTISEGVDNVVNTVNPNVDPSNIGVSGETAKESGVDQGIYHPGDTYDVVLEDVNGDGKKEVIVQDGDLNPN